MHVIDPFTNLPNEQNAVVFGECEIVGDNAFEKLSAAYTATIIINFSSNVSLQRYDVTYYSIIMIISRGISKVIASRSSFG